MNRVCIIKHSYYPQHHHVRRDAETLVQHGYAVDVIALRRKGEPARERINGVEVYRLPVEHHRKNIPRYLFEYSAFFVLAAIKLSQLHLKKRYDAVEVDTMPDVLVFTTLLPKLMGAKVVLYLFENMPELFASTFKTSQRHIGVRLLKVLERLTTSYADRVIVADGLPYLRVLKSRGVAESKMTIVLNVPNEAIFDATRYPAPPENNGFHVITHGSIIKRYGVQTLIRAVPRMIPDIPGLEVLVVGDGEYRAELEGLAQSLGVAERVRFTGLVPHDQVPALIAQAQVAVAPMVDDVGVPNKIFEYFSLGKPTVASDQPSLRDYFSDDCVLFYPPDNDEELARRLLELYRNPARRSHLVSGGQALYEKVRWNAMKRQYLGVYESLLSPRSNRQGAGD